MAFGNKKIKTLHDAAKQEISKSTGIKSAFVKMKSDLEESNNSLEMTAQPIQDEMNELKSTLDLVNSEFKSNKTVVGNIDKILGISNKDS